MFAAKVEDVSKRYRPSFPFVLSNVNIQISYGQVTSIVGPSGSGKSTLLRCIAGIEPTTSGNITLLGHVLSSEPFTGKEVAQNIGFIFQDYSLLDFLNVEDNILIAANYAGLLKPARRNIDAILDKVNLNGLNSANITELSGGQCQRVAVARAMINNPKIIFADEPTGALDGSNAFEVMNILRSAARMNTAVVLVTHDLEIASRADRALVLKEGSIVEEIKNPTPKSLMPYMHKIEK